jgi:hypothetical protein
MATRTPLFPRTTLVLSTCAAVLGCQPSLPSIGGGRGDPGAPPREPHVLLEPDTPLDAAPPVLRARVVPGEDAVADPSRVLFVRGHVGDAHVRQVEDGDLSQALTERILPVVTWPLDDGSVVLAPAQALEPGVTYGVLSGDPPLGVDVRIAAEDTVPLLHHTWPPLDAPAGPFAVLCGDDPLDMPPSHLTLAPGDVPAEMTSGVLGALGSLGARCLRIDAAFASTSAGPVDNPSSSEEAPPVAVPPALVELEGGSLVRLEPVLIPLSAPTEPPPAPEPLACAPAEIPFGPGCARVTDDRLFVATPEVPLLWVVRSRAAGGEIVRATAAGEPWVLHGLTPASVADVTLVAIDAFGHPDQAAFTIFTEPPMPHVVITEVLANPLGAEPDQEWIEIYNDGLAPADLTGHVLADLGGTTPLPPAILEPGAFALIVNETFVEDDEIDPAPAPGTALLHVAKLGKDGLKNDGEPVKLLDAGGTAISRFPMSPKPKPGQSVARVTPSAPDGVASSFAVSTPTPGAPGTPQQ